MSDLTLLFLANLIVPLMMILAGLFMWKSCPETINRMMGYRTKWSMKSIETWKFAHENCGKRWTLIGVILIVVAAVVQLIIISKTGLDLEMLVMIFTFSELGVMLLSIIPTEIALRKTFNEDGTRK